MTHPTQRPPSVSEPNYWVDDSIAGSGYVIGGTREGRVVARADTLEVAERICREMNDQEDATDA